MKHMIYILLTITLPVFSQTVSKAGDHILWIGMDNPIIINDSLRSSLFLRSYEAFVFMNEYGEFIATVDTKYEGKRILIEVFDSLPSGIEKIADNFYMVKKIPPPVLAIGKKPIRDTISRTELLSYKKFDVVMDDVDFKYQLYFELKSFQMEIDGKEFNSPSNNLTQSMIYLIENTSSERIRIKNDRTILVNSNHSSVRCVLRNCDQTFILSE